MSWNFCVFFVCVLLIRPSSCLKQEELFPFGIQDERLPSDTEDVSSDEFQLSVPIVFYESKMKSVFINENGLISFLTEVPHFLNAPFPLTYPVIAALYSDVDARDSGAVYYRFVLFSC